MTKAVVLTNGAMNLGEEKREIEKMPEGRGIILLLIYSLGLLFELSFLALQL